MKRSRILCILLAILLSGCGSKKKITDIRKDYASVKSEQKEVSSESSHSLFTDSSRTKIFETDLIIQRITEKYTFDSNGNLISYDKTTDTNQKKDKATDEKKAVKKDDVRSFHYKAELKVDSVGKREIKHVDLDRKPFRFPFGAWVFLGLVVGVVVWLRFRK